ncbi:class II aldolase/adducin family protein [Limnohabitans sp.]|uniref:class II aldolase/adducin family protein n=1 Tax=Limnohabitans sp. TaxID=1907725 RepID=UPI00286F5356|nr:class II aldolase/adducin family protein [Limnohabitans sp.]
MTCTTHTAPPAVATSTAQATCDVLRTAYQRQWITSRDGNISFREAGKNDGWVTPSGALKYALTPSNLKHVTDLAATRAELAQACEQAFLACPCGQTPDIIGLDQQGVVAVGCDPWSAYEHIERLEHICQMVLASGSGRRNSNKTATGTHLSQEVF